MSRLLDECNQLFNSLNSYTTVRPTSLADCSGLNFTCLSVTRPSLTHTSVTLEADSLNWYGEYMPPVRESSPVMCLCAAESLLVNWSQENQNSYSLYFCNNHTCIIRTLSPTTLLTLLCVFSVF